MKMIKKVLSVCLAIAITLQCGNTAFAEAASPRQEYSDDGVLYTYNADGTVTATIYTSPVVEERKTTSNEDDRLEDLGDSYVNTSEDVTVTLEKTYSDGDILVSLSDADTKQMKISTASRMRGFLPRMTPASLRSCRMRSKALGKISPLWSPEQISKRKSSSNLLQKRKLPILLMKKMMPTNFLPFLENTAYTSHL